VREHVFFGLLEVAIGAGTLDGVARTAAGDQICGSFFPLRARGTTKSTDMTRAFSKLALPSRPQYWQR